MEGLVLASRPQPLRALAVTLITSVICNERACEAKLRIEIALHLLSLLQQHVDALECPSVNLGRYDEPVACRQCIDDAHAEARRIVDEHVIVRIFNFPQALAQTHLLRDHRVEQDGLLGFGEIEIRCDYVYILIIRVLDHRLGPCRARQHLGHARLVISVAAEKVTRIALLVIVDDQHAATLLCC